MRKEIAGSMARTNLLAHVLVSKFDDHFPLYRQHEIFARMGADIPESTRVGWCGRAIRKFYDIERDINGQPADVRHAAGQKLSLPNVTGFFGLSEQQLLRIPGRSDLAKAFRYGLARQQAFSLSLADGRVAIDNNPAKRTLRLGGNWKKKWRFAGADTGAETAGAETLARKLWHGRWW